MSESGFVSVARVLALSALCVLAVGCRSFRSIERGGLDTKAAVAVSAGDTLAMDVDRGSRASTHAC